MTKKLLMALLGLFIVILFIFIYINYDVVAIVRVGLKQAWSVLIKFSRMFWTWVLRHSPVFLKRLIMRRFLKPIWAFLVFSAVVLAGPHWSKRLKSIKEFLLLRSKKLLSWWKELHWLQKILIGIGVTAIVYAVGLGLIVPLVGFSVIGSILRRIWVIITDWLIEKKTRKVRGKIASHLREYEHTRRIHDTLRKCRVMYVRGLRRRRKRE